MKALKIILQIVVVFAVYAVCGGVINGVKDNPWLSLLAGAFTVAAMVFVYRWIVGRTENREVTELQSKGATNATFWGLVFGSLMFLCVISNIYFLGDYKVDGIDSVSGAIGLIGFMAGAACTEELVFRGLLFRLVERGLGTYVALVLSGLVFGGMHLLNDDATLAGAAPSPSRPAPCSPPGTPPPATCGCRWACTSPGTSWSPASSAPRSPATATPTAC